MHSLSPLFAPKGIVVVGASAKPDKLGAVMAQSLSGYGGPVGLVNSRGEGGMHTAIADAVASLPDGADLGVLCVPAAATAQAIEDCGAAGIKAVLICAGGFAEAGGPGIQYAADVAAAAQRTGIRILGPNTSGFIVPGIDLRASFVPGVADLRAGSVGVVAASGGVNHVLAFQLERSGPGVSLAVGIGAGTDVTAADVLDYLAEDPATKAVALHLETVSNGPALVAAVSRLSAVKPVAVLVVGQNDVSEFAQSHTGALATSWRTTRAVLQQAGAVIVDSELELVAAATALSGLRLAPSANPGAALITGQAGPGLIVADALHGAGVAVPRLTQDTQDVLSTLLPPLTFQANPVDTGRPGPTYPQIVATVADDPSIDLVALYGLTEAVTDLPGSVKDSGKLGSMPFLVGVDGPEQDLTATRESAAPHGIPVLSGPTPLAYGLAALVADARIQKSRGTTAAEQASEWPRENGAPMTGPWDENQAKSLLNALGFSTPERRVCRTEVEAQAALAELGGPTVVKILDAAVLHKTDIGGVHLGVGTAEQMTAAFTALKGIGAREVLVESMAPSGVDLVVSARRDPVFGPIVMVGLGGVAAEVTADVAIRSAPLTVEQAESLPDDLQTKALLFGFRGGPTLDRRALAALLVTLGDALVAQPDVEEIEINPLRLTADGLVALDAVIITTSVPSDAPKEIK
jgi:acetyltransferase